MTNDLLGQLPHVPRLPISVFDEFGRSADDRVHAYAISYAAAAQSAERERCARLCELKGADAYTQALEAEGWTAAELYAFATAAESIAAAIRSANAKA